MKANTMMALQYFLTYFRHTSNMIQMSRDMRFPTMWYVQLAKAQTSQRSLIWALA